MKVKRFKKKMRKEQRIYVNTLLRYTTWRMRLKFLFTNNYWKLLVKAEKRYYKNGKR